MLSTTVRHRQGARQLAATTLPLLSTQKRWVHKTQLYIDGEFLDSQTTEWIEVRNPVPNAHKSLL
jgi:hypothetical protein